MNYEFDVSICCATYNQCKYIQQTLEWFSMQMKDTSLKIEVIIHDDCSSDGTQDILKKFQSENKNVKLILQNENQYSQGKKFIPILISQAKGKYIALCEGDDFWDDNNKIQLQYDYMEKHPNCSLCVHAVNYVDQNGKFLKKYFCSDSDTEIKFTDIVEKGGNYLPTLSLFFRKSDALNLPKAYYMCPICDYPLQIFLAEKGYCYYMNKVMGSYRINSIGSMTDSLYKDTTSSINLLKDLIKMFDNFNQLYNYEYDKLFSKMKVKQQYDIYDYLGDIKSLMTEPYLTVYKNLRFLERIKTQIRCRYPSFYRRIKKYARQ